MNSSNAKVPQTLDNFSKVRRGREAGFRRDLTSEYTQCGDENLERIQEVIKEGEKQE